MKGQGEAQAGGVPYFREIVGYEPFPWQRRLYARLVAGDVPEGVDIPTGLGKTLCVLLVLLARVRNRALPRRIAYILSAKDRTVGIQGYAGTGKTTMLACARTLLEKKGYEVKGLAPSASAARTLQSDAGIASETLQRFLARYAGVAEGRMTKKGEKEMRNLFAKTALVVDEGSLASTVQARDLLRIADALRIPRVVLVGDEKQLDAVDAGKLFAQLQKAGMKTAVMDEIVRQRDPELRVAVEASLAGEIGKAFEKLGENVAEVKPDNLAGAAAARWIALSPEERTNAGLIAPSHTLREDINAIVRERLVRDGAVHGPAMQGGRLVSKGYTNAEKSLAANYRPGDVVAFHRPYKRLGVEKGDELRVAGVDHAARTVTLEGGDGQSVAWEPNRVAARAGGCPAHRERARARCRAGRSLRSAVLGKQCPRGDCNGSGDRIRPWPVRDAGRNRPAPGTGRRHCRGRRTDRSGRGSRRGGHGS